MQDAAERLGKDVTRYDEESPGPMVEAAKKITSMWMKMAQLIRSEVNVNLFSLRVHLLNNNFL